MAPSLLPAGFPAKVVQDPGCRHSSLWEVSDCCDLNQCRRRPCTNQGGETEAGATPGGRATLWLHPSPAWEGTRELRVFVFWSFLQL